MIRSKEAIVSITNKCNLRCMMCDIPKVKDYLQIPTIKIKDLIDNLKEIKCKNIVFSGGEPLTHKDIFELIEFANQRGLKVCITSNGILINKETAKKLALAGIDVINISIDGNKETHEKLRGKNTFEKAVNGLKNLNKVDVETTIATIVCKQNYKELLSVIKLAKDVGATTVRFQPFSEDFLDKKNDSLFITEKEGLELERIIKQVVILANKFHINTNPESYLNNISLMVQNKLKPKPNKDCNALYETISITNMGDVLPCFPMSDKPLGNINKQRFIDIWNSNKYKKIRKEVIKGNCPGCLMSCYDNNFENKIGKIKTIISRLKNNLARKKWK
ncbi:MAG: radical SAM protein [Nanoarchaeota archaeon]|nr:radical SAM protein [Nanoarchaeota archaeon]